MEHTDQMSTTLSDMELDALRWRTLISRSDIQNVGNFESCVVFQILAGTDWTAETLTAAIDQMIKNPEHNEKTEKSVE